MRCQCAVLLGSVVSVTAEATGRSVMRHAAAGHAPLANEPALTGLVTVGLAKRIHFVTTVRNAASRSSLEAPAQQSSWNLRKSVKASARRGTCTPARGLRARVGGSLIGPLGVKQAADAHSPTLRQTLACLGYGKPPGRSYHRSVTF